MTREDIARIIKESRIAAGLTQNQVAQALGRPQATIAGWEVGRSQPDANTLFDLFRVLGRSVDDAFGFTKQPFEVTGSEREHIQKYRALDAYGRDTVSAVLECELKRCEAERRMLEPARELRPLERADGEELSIEEEEALYRRHCGFVGKTTSSASSSTDGTEYQNTKPA